MESPYRKMENLEKSCYPKASGANMQKRVWFWNMIMCFYMFYHTTCLLCAFAEGFSVRVCNLLSEHALLDRFSHGFDPQNILNTWLWHTGEQTCGKQRIWFLSVVVIFVFVDGWGSLDVSNSFYPGLRCFWFSSVRGVSDFTTIITITHTHTHTNTHTHTRSVSLTRSRSLSRLPLFSANGPAKQMLQVSRKKQSAASYHAPPT